MNSLAANFFQNYLAQHQQPNHSGNLLGSGPMDWLLNAATFAGTDALLNKVEGEEGKHPHLWRNAGLAGALALAYQWYRNHHQQPQYDPDQQQLMYYTQPQPESYYYYYPQPYYPQHQQQQQYIMPPSLPSILPPLPPQLQPPPVQSYGIYNNNNPYMMQQPYPSHMMMPNMAPFPPMTPYFGPQQPMTMMMPYQHRYPFTI